MAGKTFGSRDPGYLKPGLSKTPAPKPPIKNPDMSNRIPGSRPHPPMPKAASKAATKTKRK